MSKTDSYSYEIDLENDQTVAAKIFRLIGKEKRVLELGMAAGHMSRIMKEHLGCTVVGMEIAGEWAEQGKPWCERVIVGDIEALDLDATLGDDRFDVILSADVLEHLRDPWVTLEKLKRFLKPDGKVVISLPNVNFHGLLGELCDGRFSYRDKGILDDTHLRFFTRHELELLVLSAGLVPQAWDQALLGAEHSEFAASWERLPATLQEHLKAIPDGQVYQHVFSAKLPSKDAWDAWLSDLERRIEGGVGVRKELTELKAAFDAKSLHCHNLEELAGELRAHVASLQSIASDNSQHILNFQAALAEKDNCIGALRNELDSEREAGRNKAQKIADLIASQTELGKTVSSLKNQVASRESDIGVLSQALDDKDRHIKNIEAALSENECQYAAIVASNSWKITSPLRRATKVVHSLKEVAVRVGALRIRHGGYLRAGKKAIRVLRSEGIAGVMRRIKATVPAVIDATISAAPDGKGDYQDWIARYDTLSESDKKMVEIKIGAMSSRPTISILMPIFNTPELFLRKALDSVLSQLYPYWELCIADDASTDESVRRVLNEYAARDSRIRTVFRTENGHIAAASNSALELASGEYLGLLDHDDELAPLALYWVAKSINANPDVVLMYSDEDKIDLHGCRSDPYFKPDWNPDLLRSQNYLCHFSVYRSETVREVGGFRVGLDGSQDYDLALRVTERIKPEQICHIPKLLYHWRMIPGSTALGGTDEKPYTVVAALRALNEHFERSGISAVATEANDVPGMYRAKYALPKSSPLVSIVIPTRNGLDILCQCITSIFDKTTYPNYEIVVVDNASDDPKILRYFSELEQCGRVTVLRDPRPFNYSALNNGAVQQAKGEVIALLNNDIEVISPDWLDEMVSQAMRPEIGAVGARLWYSNNTLQHAGVILVCGVAGHAHKYLEKGDYGYFGRAALQQNYSAVTAACLVVRKDVYLKVGGLDENIAVAFNDVDFCLRVLKAGYRNTWTPYAELYHHESLTRGYEDTPEKQERFKKEVEFMQRRWGDLLLNDPALNPNLDWNREGFFLSFPPRIERI